jgi:hypothetical protein
MASANGNGCGIDKGREALALQAMLRGCLEGQAIVPEMSPYAKTFNVLVDELIIKLDQLTAA